MTPRTEWQAWPIRFRAHMHEQGRSTNDVAALMGISAPTLRSWLNGHRQINLSDFFRLCDVSGFDPAMILFGHAMLTPEARRQIGEAFSSLLEADPASNPNYAKLVGALRRDYRKLRKP